LKTILFSCYQCDQRIRGFFLNEMRYINPRFTYLITYLVGMEVVAKCHVQHVVVSATLTTFFLIIFCC